MTDNDSYYEICIALDSLDLLDSELAKQLQDIYTSAIVDFTQDAVEITDSKIIIRTSENRAFIDTLLAHIGDLSANLSEIWQKSITTTNTIEIKQNRDWIAEYKSGIKPLQCGRFYIYPPWEKPQGNSPLELHSARLRANFECSQTPSLVSHSKFAENYESQTENPSVVDSARSAESSENKSARSANPCKSFCYFWLLPKVESPLLLNSNLQKNADSAIDSAKNHLDSAPSKQEANSSIFDEKSGLCSHERGNRTDEFIDEASGKLPDLSQKDAEFATINILLEPSLAFGTGHHSSTFMCIEAIQALHAQDSLKNKKVLDFGCGSGILALCASKLGAVVDLCDIDESAIVESKKNFNNNNATISHIWQGGIADRIATHKNGVSSAKGDIYGIYDIILANIIASVLIEQKDNIVLSLKRGGIAVLSGILDIYKDEVLARFSDFTPLAIRQSDEWICAVLQKA